MQFHYIPSSLTLAILLSGCGGGTLVNPPNGPSSDNADVREVVENPIDDEQRTSVQPQQDQPQEDRTATNTQSQYSLEDVTDLVLVTGQSNALGALTGFEASLDSPHERVFAFTENGWESADLHQVWDRGWFPRGHPGRDPSNNVAMHIGKQLALRDENKVIGFILVTAPGQGIEHWNTQGSFFQQINQRVHSAINQMPHKSSIDGIFWHQGESDDGDPGYGLKLNQLIEDFRLQSWYSHESPFICGETAEFDFINEQLMALNSDGDRTTACVESDGLQTFGDGYHFSAPGLRELGKRYAQKYLQID